MHIADLQELKLVNVGAFSGRQCWYLGHCGPQPQLSVQEMWNSTQSFVTKKAGGQVSG